MWLDKWDRESFMIPLKPFLDSFFMKIQKKVVAAIVLKCIMSVSNDFYGMQMHNFIGTMDIHVH